jgi:copper transporter 1
MDMGGGHDMGGMMSPPPSPAGGAHAGGMSMHMRYTHMTFFWGKNSEILFTGWPGANGGMYALALVAVFALAFVLEFLGSRRLDALLPAAAGGGNGGRRAVAGAARAAVYAVRVGGAYLLMLALMSFNGGVLLVAVAGHAAGFLAFRAGLFGDGRAQVEDRCNKEEVAPVACC